MQFKYASRKMRFADTINCLDRHHLLYPVTHHFESVQLQYDKHQWFHHIVKFL